MLELEKTLKVIKSNVSYIYLFLLTFQKSVFKNRLAEKEGDEKARELPSIGSLLKLTQQSGLCQAKAMSHSPIRYDMLVVGTQVLGHHLLPHRCINRKLDWKPRQDSVTGTLGLGTPRVS